MVTGYLSNLEIYAFWAQERQFQMYVHVYNVDFIYA